MKCILKLRMGKKNLQKFKRMKREIDFIFGERHLFSTRSDQFEVIRCFCEQVFKNSNQSFVDCSKNIYQALNINILSFVVYYVLRN